MRCLMVTLLAGLALVAFALPAHAAHVQCGAFIISDTTLDSDLVGCPQDGIVIAAGNVTLDLNGHTISGLGTGAGIRGASGPTLANVVIQGRGTVTAFRAGVDLQTIADSTVRDLTLRQNRTGILANQTFGHLIVDNDVRDNADAGIEQSDSENGSRATRIEHNSIRGNGGNGIRLVFSGAEVVDNDIAGNAFSGVVAFSGRVDASGNRIEGNGGDGISLSSFATGTIVSNVISRNSRDGIQLEGAAQTEALSDNTIERNGRHGVSIQAGAGGNTLIERNRLGRNAVDGIFVSVGAQPPVIRANRSDRHGDDGIDADVPGTTLGDNRTDHNVDLGIEAVPGVIDGGGNRAKHNGNPAQCLNVACSK